MKNPKEQILKLVADFDAFCAPGAEMEAAFNGDELNAEELDLIAAAGTTPLHTEQSPNLKEQHP